MTLIYFLLIFSILVLAHEWGHFIVAKKFGLTVHEFGFGFPPRMLSRVWRGTRYSLNWLPLGGFVRIKGEEGEGGEEVDSFASRKVWQRAAIIVAGVAMNVVVGWALFTTGFLVGIPSFVDETVPAALVRDRQVIVRTVLQESPAEKANLRVGDVLLEVNGTPITTLQDLQKIVAEKDGVEVSVMVDRNDVRHTVAVTPQYIPEAKRIGIGVGIDEIGIVRYPFFTALYKGVVTTFSLLRDIVLAFWNLLLDIVVQQRVSADLSGPIGIAVLTGQIARRGIAHVIQFAALLSLNLAVLNILPIPALDGGRFLFLLIEKIRGKPVPRAVEGLVHRIGFVLLILLVILVTYKDIVRLVASNV